MVLLLGASWATQLRSESCCSRRESSEALSFRSLRSHPCVRRYTLSRVLLRLLLFNAQKKKNASSVRSLLSLSTRSKPSAVRLLASKVQWCCVFPNFIHRSSDKPSKC
jgi:hypothetical protein